VDKTRYTAVQMEKLPQQAYTSGGKMGLHTIFFFGLKVHNM